jgi:hypothetical protein
MQSSPSLGPTIHVIDKPALSLRLAQAYVSDLVEEGTR